ncbi:hypothetical protein R1CP_35790 (plasmid) [Rhodococcus opacus]|uniref:UvrD-like helicase ATP-binding domain-containing protein n=1 Tax=Rhodococcus opacus TaxID=37919 RepID=A0A1B1KGN8_RHOOP|nr:UvrD-helicase domain-containing protein [Rhodococcus opacus]ANS31764.1 hypothetical protein R1CP_35790 [Rhodococcus opacus]
MTALYRDYALARDRIQTLAAGLGMQLTDHEQWEFLQSYESLDLQAAPGSGKTSLVGLKLLALAEHWTSTTRGICVLSHTNTAKDEIVARISHSPAGARLQRYPHFIGTIQSFTSMFLARPYLRGMRKQVQIVDDAAYADQAKRVLARDRRFRTLSALLGRQHNGEELVAHAYYRFESERLIARSSRKLPFGPDTNSGQQFTALKHHMARQGIFRYADMFALAELHLALRPTLASAVAQRFPFVLLDEMQDTSELQQKLLDRVFNYRTAIVQRVGDINQRIFADGTITTSSFPRPDSLELPISRRFGSDIAQLASSLTVHRSQRIHGAGPTGTIAVLLYDEASVTEVVPAFERIAAETVPREILLDRPPRVLASRLQPGTSKSFPQSLACYAPEFVSRTPGDRRASLLITARAARAQWRSGASRAAVDLLWEAVRVASRSIASEGLPAMRRLDRDTDRFGGRMRTLLLDILADPLDDDARWGHLMDRMTGLLSELESAGPDGTGWEELAAYVAPPATHSPTPSPACEAMEQVDRVRSELGSIQSAKGETHPATLILECLSQTGKNYDVHEVLSLLATRRDPATATPTVRKIAQLVFVGATRPTQLLAFAVNRDRAKPYLDYLSSTGWAIHDLTVRKPGGVDTAPQA